MADPTTPAAAPNAISKTMSHTGVSPLVLKVRVMKGRDLAPKDKSGFSDPYLVLVLGDARQATSAQYRTLNPEWEQNIELPIVGLQSAVLDCVCWDKDRFGKDYMGEIEVAIEDIFANGKAMQEPRWFPLESKRPGKKTGVVTGDVQLQFSIADPSNPTAQPTDILKRLFTIIGTSTSDLGEDVESPESEPQEEINEAGVTGLGAAATIEEKKKKKYLKIANLKKKAQQRAYEFGNGSVVAGVLFIEIQRITDLPPERNVTRTGFDMDPFVVISLGRKTYRTRVIRHNLNPVFDEKLVFQVARHETSYSMSFSVVDRDNFSGNDYVGKVDLPLEKVINLAPEPDQSTGLFAIPDGLVTPNPEAKKSRFRLPLSRSASSQSLSKQARMTPSREPSAPNLQVPTSTMDSVTAPSSTGAPPTSDPAIGLAEVSKALVADDDSLKPFILPLNLKNKDKWPDKKSTLYIRAKYVPYHALRQQFWRSMLRQYDADESGRIDKVELTTMLDSLGSTLHESTIDGFFARYPEENRQGELPSLSFDEAVICLEDQLSKTVKSKHTLTHTISNLSLFGGEGGSESGTATPSLSQSMAGFSLSPDAPDMGEEPPALEPLATMDSHGLSDDREEEHVIEIRECPICHQPRLNKRSDSDIVTHIATCASQDWRKVNNIVMGGFVTASQAQRKWYSKVVTKISYGGYRLGANSANILVQDRLTGQINEEKMSVYVRLGIRLLYKGLKANNMEMKRIKRLLKSMSIKQGNKYDDPASAAQIRPFIDFHGLDMSEVLLPVEQFKNFNEFFFRALKPDARPCAAPNSPHIVTSPADCRSVVFNSLDEAQKIWVKGRNFTVERLLGPAYPEDTKRFIGGAMGIFRLAPQDYHRFHVPVDGIMGEPRLIEGDYYTVNPMAIRSALDVYGENIRVIVPIDSVAHGRVIVVCVGAMMVGSTVITRKTGEKVKRAEELGYFKFGGSTILVLFEKGKIEWDDDLVDNSSSALETLIQVGMSVAHTTGQDQFRDNYQKREEDITEADKADAQRRIVGGTGAGHPLI